MKTVTLKLTDAQIKELDNALIEKAMELEDDGREGDPTAKLLYDVDKQLRQQFYWLG